MTEPIADLNLIEWWDRSITLYFDSDSETNAKVREALNALSDEVYRRGARSVYRIDLPTGETGDKNGMDDFLQANGIEAFLDLDAEEISSPYPRIRVLTGADLQAMHIERPGPIVKGWGIRKSGKVILTGAGGRGKSTLLLQAFCCDMAAGKPLLGNPSLPVTSPQRVAVLMGEDPLSEVKYRWEQQMSALGYGNEIAQRIAFLDPQGAKIMLTSEYARTALFDALRRHQADTCILDPLVALHEADENSNSAMRWVLDLLSPFQEETGCAFIIAHHEPKAPENNSAASRGASAIRDWCRTMLRLTAPKKGPDGSQRFQLDLDKCNYGGTVWQLILERKQDSYIFTPIDPEMRVTPKDVWETVGTDGLWLDDLKHALCETFGVSEVTARRAIKKAEEMKLVTVGEQINETTNRKKSFVLRGAHVE